MQKNSRQAQKICRLSGPRGIPSHRDCTNMVCWIRQMYRQTVEPVCRRGIMKNWQIILPGAKEMETVSIIPFLRDE